MHYLKLIFIGKNSKVTNLEKVGQNAVTIKHQVSNTIASNVKFCPFKFTIKSNFGNVSLNIEKIINIQRRQFPQPPGLYSVDLSF